MNVDVDIKEFLFSLAWSTWSAYHYRNAIDLLKKCNPNVDAEVEIKNFISIIESQPGPGSPK